MGHAASTNTPRTTRLARTLFAVDELTGLVQAAALVRPGGDIQGLELSSLRKRFRNPAFAAGVNRAEVAQGAEELGVELDAHLGNVLQALKEDAAGHAPSR